MFTSLLSPSSDQVMIQVGGYNCAICYAQLTVCGYVQTEQLSDLPGNKDVNTLAESLY